MKMEAGSCSETLVLTYQSTWHSIPKVFESLNTTCLVEMVCRKVLSDLCYVYHVRVKKFDKVSCVSFYSLWLPLFIPHMAGAGLPPATMNRSLLHMLSIDSGPAVVN
jgi:hypothetical protein